MEQKVQFLGPTYAFSAEYRTDCGWAVKEKPPPLSFSLCSVSLAGFETISRLELPSGWILADSAKPS